MIVAAIRDRTGSYTGGFALLLALAVIGALAVSLLPSSKVPSKAQAVSQP
jgi:hypothetical protein